MSDFDNAGKPEVAVSPGQPAAAVSVVAPARLHLGFLDPSGTLGRRFGSLGMMIDGMATRIRVAHAGTDQVVAESGAEHEIGRLRRLLRQLKAATGREEPLAVRIDEALPAHVGLGSGTQLALAAGRAFSELHGLGLSTPSIANLLDRGARSGIGIAGFDQGGVLVDGGPRAGANAPPVLARFDFPSEWRVILVQDPARSGLHGDSEKEGMARLPFFEQARAAHLCHLVLMQILPALAEAEFAPFAAGLSELQAIVGEYFAPAQGGVYTSPDIARLMRWIAERHQAGVGQTSWGPTAFAVMSSEARAQEVLREARSSGALGQLVATIVPGRNQGASVVRHPDLSAAAGARVDRDAMPGSGSG
jgi:beta-RFAP synthase